MKNILTTFGFGKSKDCLDLTYPSFLDYSLKYDYDIYVPNENFFSKYSKNKPFSWWKIELICKLLNDYDNVIWIDSDILIYNNSKNLLDDFNACNFDMGLVVHDVSLGQIPNCGLWILNKKSLAWLSDIYKFDNKCSLADYWWEQAALMCMMGFDFNHNPIQLPNKFKFNWKNLPYYWNPHICDRRGISSDCLFFHSTMFKNKIEAILHVKKYGFKNLENLEIIKN